MEHYHQHFQYPDQREISHEGLFQELVQLLSSLAKNPWLWLKLSTQNTISMYKEYSPNKSFYKHNGQVGNI